MKGEVEGSTESTGRGDVLARPEASWCASWRAAGRVWACLGARGLGGVDVILVNGLQEQLQEGQGKAADMVEWLGWERRGGEHGEVTRGPARSSSGQKWSKQRQASGW